MDAAVATGHSHVQTLQFRVSPILRQLRLRRRHAPNQQCRKELRLQVRSLHRKEVSKWKCFKTWLPNPVGRAISFPLLFSRGRSIDIGLLYWAASRHSLFLYWPFSRCACGREGVSPDLPLEQHPLFSAKSRFWTVEKFVRWSAGCFDGGRLDCRDCGLRLAGCNFFIFYFFSSRTFFPQKVSSG